MKKAFGIFLVSLPFLTISYIMVQTSGVVYVMQTLGLVALVVISIIVGICLLADSDGDDNA